MTRTWSTSMVFYSARLIITPAVYLWMMLGAHVWRNGFRRRAERARGARGAKRLKKKKKRV